MVFLLVGSLALALSGSDSTSGHARDVTPVTSRTTPTAVAKSATAPSLPSTGIGAFALGDNSIADAYRAALLAAPAPLAVDSLVLQKSAHTLLLFERGVPVKAYLVALGGNPVGDKVRAGDGRTPEGTFHIDNKNPASKYHLSMHLSYPDAVHRARAASMHVSPGGDIMIHGLPRGYEQVGAAHRQNDWTEGCIAVTDQEIEQIFAAVKVGTPITVQP